MLSKVDHWHGWTAFRVGSVLCAVSSQDHAAMTADEGQGLRIEIRGVPRAQPRGRHVNGRVVSTTGPAVRWRQLVREATLAAIEAATADGSCFPLVGPVELMLCSRVPTKDRERWGRWYTAVRRLDADNLAKLCMDVVTQAGC